MALSLLVCLGSTAHAQESPSAAALTLFVIPCLYVMFKPKEGPSHA